MSVLSEDRSFLVQLFELQNNKGLETLAELSTGGVRGTSHPHGMSVSMGGVELDCRASCVSISSTWDDIARYIVATI